MLFTHPVMLGDAAEVQCAQEKLAAVQFSDPSPEGAASNAACFCNNRYVHIQVESSVSSFVEQDGDTEGDHGHMCLVPGQQSTSSAFVEQGAVGRSSEERRLVAMSKMLQGETMLDENDVPVVLQGCEADATTDQAKDWVFLVSTGQIKHGDTGMCLTAMFPTD